MQISNYYDNVTGPLCRQLQKKELFFGTPFSTAPPSPGVLLIFNLVILIVLSVHSTEAGTAEFSDVFEFLISPLLAFSD